MANESRSIVPRDAVSGNEAAYRGRCRLRMGYACLQVDAAWLRVDWKPHEWCRKRAEFWERSYRYWKKKLEKSLRREEAARGM